MLQIKVFGTTPPCASCKRAEMQARKAAEQFSGQVEVVKLVLVVVVVEVVRLVEVEVVEVLVELLVVVVVEVVVLVVVEVLVFSS